MVDPKITERITVLETELNDYDPGIRSRALSELATMVQEGAIAPTPEADVANMHCHSFHSFNMKNNSPSSLAWIARKNGIKLAGIVDFDTLGGVEEFLAACDQVGVRGSAGLETRVFIPEFASREINSPGEPGVCYLMGTGFISGEAPPEVRGILNDLRRRAEERNRGMVARINGFLHPLTIDYQEDVLPLTPSGNATERHIVTAYVQKAAGTIPDPLPFWAVKLGVTIQELRNRGDDAPEFLNLIRSRLMKRGGSGYVPPGPETFPPIDQFLRLVTACGALPCAAWLDGTSEGEEAIEELLEFLINRGIVALNIIPDRNWNIPDPELRRVKLRNLYRVVELAGELALPLNVGTEMNSYGQKLVDDFDSPELAPVRRAFLDGAYFIYGHTLFQRNLRLGYMSDWAATHMSLRSTRNDFYTRIGRLIPPGVQGEAALSCISAEISPAEIMEQLEGEEG